MSLFRLGVCLVITAISGSASAQITAANYVEEVTIGGLGFPTNVEFAPDGRVFITEKGGKVRVFDSVDDTQPDTPVDLSTQVMDFWDRGLLGLALHPNFPQTPYIYVAYAYDAPLGQQAPVWHDNCGDATGTGCQATGRLSRFELDSSNKLVGGERVLISEQFCQQGPGHSVGDLEFSADGSLFMSAGDGANGFDVGNTGDGSQSCPDPDGEGGALRAQDVLTPGDSTTFSGSVIRVDANSGLAAGGNPLGGGPSSDDDAVVAFGFRNPFRLAVRPGTNELWVGDVGWGQHEEINRVVSSTDGVAENFGWPCFEGDGQVGNYSTTGRCQQLYSNMSWPIPTELKTAHFSYPHSGAFGGSNCDRGEAGSISGLDFYDSASQAPDDLRGALVFSDYARKCLWAMKPDGSGVPNPDNVITLVAHPGAGAADAPGPVDVERGPDGHMYYVDLLGGTLRRVRYNGGVDPPPDNRPPRAQLVADVRSGSVPLDVVLDASASSDPDGDTLQFTWDLNGDGSFGDATSPTVNHTFDKVGTTVVRVRVSDGRGGLAFAENAITAVEGQMPDGVDVSMVSPAPGQTWEVGEELTLFANVDPGETGLSASSFDWDMVLHHCPDECHIHVLQSFKNIVSPKVRAPDHEYPAFLQFRATVTMSNGGRVVETIDIHPKTSTIQIATEPAGLPIAVGPKRVTEATGVEVIVGSTNSVTAISPAILDEQTYAFDSWSDNGAQSHVVIADETTMNLTATYKRVDGGLPDAGVGPQGDSGVGGTGGGASLDGATCAVGVARTRDPMVAVLFVVLVSLVWRRRGQSSH